MTQAYAVPKGSGDAYADTAGDPGEGAELPAMTGRDEAAGVPDRFVDEDEGDGA